MSKSTARVCYNCTTTYMEELNVKIKQLAVTSAAFLMLSLAACADKQNPANQSSSAPISPSPSAVQPSQQASVTPEPAPTPEPTPEPSKDVEVVKSYRMDKAYRIVPIDPETTNKKVVLLTFDDGPKAEETLLPLLDTLDKHEAKAIFFVNGYRVKAKPELLVQIHDRGQVIGNHSWDHIYLGKEKPEVIEEQLIKVQDIVKEIVGKTPIFFRPPFASANEHVHEIAKAQNLLYMTWSNGSLDWDLNKTPIEKRPQAVIDNVLEQLHSGSNILMHELAWTAEALDSLLTQLEERGYSFVDPNAIDPTL